MPLIVVAIVVLTVTVSGSLIGMRVGHRLRETLSDSERVQLYGMQASLLGLLALLLGFSFGLAQTRYDLRRQFLVEEANAIGTARLRTAAVPDGPGREIGKLLEQYVAVRLNGYAARDDATLMAAIEESSRLQKAAWARASALARQEPTSLPVALLLQSLNEVIDSHAKRMEAGRNHIPTVVLLLLLLLSAVAMGWVGAGLGVSSRHGTATTLLLSVLISAVVLVIVDLDQPRRGIVRIDPATLVDLQRSFR